MVSISMSSDHRDKRTMGFFFHLKNQISLYRWLHEVNNRGFIFEGIRRWHVINFVTLIRGYSYLVLLEIVGNYKTVRSLQETQVNLSVLLDKPDITYSGIFNTESLEPGFRISPRPRTMLKIFYFSRGIQFLQISPKIKPLYDRGRKLIYLLVGEA